MPHLGSPPSLGRDANLSHPPREGPQQSWPTYGVESGQMLARFGLIWRLARRNQSPTMLPQFVSCRPFGREKSREPCSGHLFTVGMSLEHLLTCVSCTFGVSRFKGVVRFPATCRWYVCCACLGVRVGGFQQGGHRMHVQPRWSTLAVMLGHQLQHRRSCLAAS